jgi:hypothetical protein
MNTPISLTIAPTLLERIDNFGQSRAAVINMAIYRGLIKE